MTNCTDCRYQENMCKWPCDDCVKGDKWEERPLTNADKIRAMTDEEIADWIYDITTNALRILQIGSDMSTQSYFGWLNWLKQEAAAIEAEGQNELLDLR